MAKLEAGLIGKHSLVVEEKHLASSVGSGDVAVFSTPFLVALVEAAAVDCLKGRLAEGDTSVGTNINIAHLAPTPPGATVHSEATLLSIEGKILKFKVVARDHKDKIGEGSHDRVIVNKDRFSAKANSKASQ